MIVYVPQLEYVFYSILFKYCDRNRKNTRSDKESQIFLNLRCYKLKSYGKIYGIIGELLRRGIKD